MRTLIRFILLLLTIIPIQAMEPSDSLLIKNKALAIIAENNSIYNNINEIMKHQQMQQFMLAQQQVNQEFTKSLIEFVGSLTKIIETVQKQVKNSEVNSIELLRQLSQFTQRQLTPHRVKLSPSEINVETLNTNYQNLQTYLGELSLIFQQSSLTPLDYQKARLLMPLVQNTMTRTYGIAYYLLQQWIQNQNAIAIQVIQRI